MSTAAGPPDALTRRIEQLAAAAGQEPEEELTASVVAVVEGLRAEVCALRTETTAVRNRLDGLSGRVDAAGEDTRGALEARLAVLEDALRAELLSALRAGREQAARDRDATADLAVAVRTALDGVRSALAPEQERAARLMAAVEAGLDHVRAQVTTELTGARRELASAISSQVATAVDAQTVALGPRVEALTAAAGATDASLRELRTELLTTVSEDLRRTLSGLSDQTAARLQAIDDQVARQLDAVRAQFETRADELAGTLARGLLDIAEEVDIAATTTRDASSRVTVLAELSEAQRVEVERLLRELREEVVARTGELVAGLGQRVDELGLGLGSVDATLSESTAGAERVAAALEQLQDSTGRLDAAVAGFRTEWPTRTYEVVQGARAVAEGVVLDVRAEVGASLDSVRAVLRQVVGSVDAARTDLGDGTDRLARAGSVLVAYLEQRDRLLEAERDRVLHDVLEAFAAGLSSRERSALAARVTDVVARRRDARDAERYRAAVGSPVSPTVELPEQVSTLAPPPAGEGGPPATDEPVPVPEAAAPDGALGDGPLADGPVPGPSAGEPPPAPAANAPKKAPPKHASGVQGRSAAAVGRPAGARRTPGGAPVVPGPGRQGDVAMPAAARTAAAGRRAARTVAAPGRGRLGTMPSAPRVDVALDAASRPAPAHAGGAGEVPDEPPTGPLGGTGPRPS